MCIPPPKNKPGAVVVCFGDPKLEQRCPGGLSARGGMNNKARKMRVAVLSLVKLAKIINRRFAVSAYCNSLALREALCSLH
jgi:hypothetical protein